MMKRMEGYSLGRLNSKAWVNIVRTHSIINVEVRTIAFKLYIWNKDQIQVSIITVVKLCIFICQMKQFASNQLRKALRSYWHILLKQIFFPV